MPKYKPKPYTNISPRCSSLPVSHAAHILLDGRACLRYRHRAFTVSTIILLYTRACRTDMPACKKCQRLLLETSQNKLDRISPFAHDRSKQLLPPWTVTTAADFTPVAEIKSRPLSPTTSTTFCESNFNTDNVFGSNRCPLADTANVYHHYQMCVFFVFFRWTFTVPPLYLPSRRGCKIWAPIKPWARILKFLSPS